MNAATYSCPFLFKCDEHNEFFWLAQLREDVGIETQGNDEILITWLISKKGDGIYVVQFNDIVNFHSIICNVSLIPRRQKKFELVEDQRKNIEEVVSRMEAEDLGMRLKSSSFPFTYSFIS